MKNMIDNNQKIDLPKAMEEIVKTLLSRGGVCKRIPGTKVYSVYLGKNIFNFVDEIYAPAISYVYGILFSNKRYVRSILEQNNIQVVLGKSLNGSYRTCITKDGYLNVLLRNSPQVIGNSSSSLKELLIRENLKRINNPDSRILPIKIDKNIFSKKHLSFSYIPKVGEKIILNSISDLENGATFIDMSSSINKPVIVLAKKILSLFPNLNYLCFDYFDNKTVANVDLSLSPNIFFMMRKGARNRKAAEVISDLIIKNQ
jgi:hypothetical protein